MSRPVDRVLAALDAYHLRENGRDRWRSCCPGHSGSNRSALSIGVGDNDAVLLRCWQGCDIEQIVGALGLSLSDLFPAKPENGHGAGPLRRRRLLSAQQALDLLQAEALVLFVVGSDMHHDRGISDGDFARLGSAVARIQALGQEVYS